METGTRPRPMENIIGNLVIGTIFVVCAYFLGDLGTLQCTRVDSNVDCLVQEKWLGIFNIGEWTILGVQKATLNKYCDEGCSYFADLTGVNGTVELRPNNTCAMTSREDAVDRINKFLQDSNADSFELTLLSFDISCPQALLPALFVFGPIVPVVKFSLRSMRMLFRKIISPNAPQVG